MSDTDLHINEKSKVQREDVIARNKKVVNVRDYQINPDNYGHAYIPEFNGIRLTVDKISAMNMEEREEVAKFVFDFYRKGGFPYPKFSDEDLKNDWCNLKELDINSDTVILDKYLSTNNGRGSHLFKNFMECYYDIKENKPKSKSMTEAFEDDELLMKIIRNRLGITFIYRGEHFCFNISGRMIKQGFRSTRTTNLVSTFRSSAAKYFYETYAPENGKVLDLSMGMGQRALGALSSKKNLEYYSCDPWDKTIDQVRTMLSYIEEKIDSGINGRYHLNQIGSENFCPEKLYNKIDFHFSSPPYFEAEYYSSDPTQCYNAGYENFINVWWKQTVENASKLLKKDAIFAFNMMEKYKKHNLLEDMLKVLNDYGFKETDRYFLHLAKSHLTKKVGTDNLKKLEPIVILERK